jgi:hypothetical protein
MKPNNNKKMMVLVNSSNNTGLRKQVFPIDYETEMSQRLVDAVHHGETDIAIQYLLNPSVDVNFIGTVLLKSKTTEIVLQDELPHRVHSVYQEFKTEVTALFLAAHSGNFILIRKLLVCNVVYQYCFCFLIISNAVL